MLRGRDRASAVLVLGAGWFTGCAGAGSAPAAATSVAGSAASPRGSLIVLAASSLVEAFGDGRATLQREHPGLAITLSFAGSQTLVTEVENGAPADVVATADAATLAKLVAAGLVQAPRTFARNRLEIAVAPGNPRHLAALADLARGDLKVILADPSVPAGRYARQALDGAGVVVHPVSLALDVRSELLAVEQGNADAAIVYVTDVTAAAPAVTGVAIPDAANVVASYPIAVVGATHNPVAAAAFVSDVLGGGTHDALLARGFLPP